MALWYLAAGLAAKTIFRMLPKLGGKAGRWQAGQQGIWEQLAAFKAAYPEPPFWFHAASLGEFEQAKPILLALRERHPGVPVVVSFFSPSGYEARKNFAQAEWITYLPLDGGSNARRWVQALQPRAVFWVKYEFWLGYLAAVRQANTPLYLLAALPKPKYFQGIKTGYYTEAYRYFTRILLQYPEYAEVFPKSLQDKVVVTGDPRYDNVLAGVAAAGPLPELERFRSAYAKPILLVGSGWKADMDVLLPALRQLDNPFRLVIFPHEMHADFLAYLEREAPGKVSFWSRGIDDTAQTLVVDRVGFLSRAYAYGDLAWVGGAFGSGLHNILEAAAWGKAVLCGSKVENFPEAGKLAYAGGCFPVADTEAAVAALQPLLDERLRNEAGSAARRFVESQAGATQRILDVVEV